MKMRRRASERREVEQMGELEIRGMRRDKKKNS